MVTPCPSDVGGGQIICGMEHQHCNLFAMISSFSVNLPLISLIVED
jgi:hypothetical protein